jgi:hypothetical protein
LIKFLFIDIYTGTDTKCIQFIELFLTKKNIGSGMIFVVKDLVIFKIKKNFTVVKNIFKLFYRVVGDLIYDYFVHYENY